MKKILLIILIFTLMRLYPILTNQYCFSDDCPAYLNAITGKEQFKEPLFMFFSQTLSQFGINEIAIMKIFMIFIPMFFSFGLYVYMRKRFKPHTTLIIITAMNMILTINVFWFVMVRNGLMLVFLPFVLHYLEEDIDIAMILMIFMMISHVSFFLFTIPIAIYLIKKDQSFIVEVGIIIGLSMLFLFLYHNVYVVPISTFSMTNLNYIQLDIFFMFLAILSVLFVKTEKPQRIIFLFIVIISLLMFFTSVELYRVLFLINIPALLLAAEFLDEFGDKKIFKYLTYIYVIFLFMFFITYSSNLKSISEEDVNMYYYIGGMNKTVVTSPEDYQWVRYFTNQNTSGWTWIYNFGFPNNYDYILYEKGMPIETDGMVEIKRWDGRILYKK